MVRGRRGIAPLGKLRAKKTLDEFGEGRIGVTIT